MSSLAGIMWRREMKRAAAAASVVAALALGADASQAGDLDRVPPISHQATLKECGGCHMAYQPALLPRQVWAAILGDLANHFGEDASLPPAIAAEIRDYLVDAARPAPRAEDRPLRITEQRWWQREHDEIPSARWRSPEVGTKGNCAVCHPGAERGIYDDD